MELELKDIQMTYAGRRDAESQLLKGITLKMEEGKITALVGGNGTGKTTLFNIISGFEKGFQGQVLLDGEDVSRFPAHRIARKGVGRLFQGRQLMEDLTLLENMMIADDDHTGEKPFDTFLRHRKVAAKEASRAKKAKEILIRLFGENTPLLGKLGNKATELSYGQQRLVALARLLMGKNHLLLLDEPTSGVNPENIRTIGQTVREIADRDGMTVFLIEHNLDFVRSFADRCYYLKDGFIFRSGTPEEVLNDPEIRKDYVGL